MAKDDKTQDKTYLASVKNVMATIGNDPYYKDL